MLACSAISLDGRLAKSISLASRRLEEEPTSALRFFVDPNFEEARGRAVAVFRFACRVELLSHFGRELFVVFAELGKHVVCFRQNSASLSRIRFWRLMSPIDRIADAFDLSRALRDGVADRKNLIGLLVEKKMVVAVVRTAHVPMKVLRLDVEREHVREEPGEARGDVARRGGFEIRRRAEVLVNSISFAFVFFAMAAASKPHRSLCATVTLSVMQPQHAVAIAIREIHDEPDREPHQETKPIRISIPR